MASKKQQETEKTMGTLFGGMNPAAIKKTEQAIEIIKSSEIRIGAFLWTPIGLQVDGQVKRSDWEETGRLLKKLNVSLQWIIGDFIVAGEDLHYGGQEEFAEQLGYAYKTIREYAYVARSIDLSIRMDNLSFGHHQVVAGLGSPEEQRKWLQLASENNWSVGKLRQQLMPRLDDGDKTPLWFKPVKLLQEKYQPERWKKMKKERRKQVYESLKALVEQMARDFDE